MNYNECDELNDDAASETMLNSTSDHGDCTNWFKPKGLKLMHLNVHHLVPKVDQIQLLLGEQAPDILGLSETFLKTKHGNKLLEQEGYTLERKDRTVKDGGGVLCYIKDSLPFRRRLDLEHGNLEAIWLEIMYPSSKNILVCMLYRPPNSKVNWFKLFEKSLEQTFLESNKEVIILGDVNIDFTNISSLEIPSTSNLDPKQKRLLNILKRNNLTQVVSTPTRVTQHTRSLIDHVYTTAPHNVGQVTVPNFNLSDHYPVCITRKEERIINSSHKTITYRSTKMFNENDFMAEMFNAPWHNINRVACPDEAVALFNSMFTDILDRHMPLVTKRVRSHCKPGWMNSDIKDAIYERDFYKKKGNITMYKKCRNRICNLIRAAKKDYYKKAVRTNSRNTQDVWRHLKKVCPDKKQNCPNILKGPKPITDSMEIAEAMNMHFAAIPGKYVSNPHNLLSNAVSEAIVDYVDSKINTSNMFSLPAVQTDFVLKQFKSINTSKATGLDGISAKALKIASPAIISAVTKMCNLSIQTGHFPAPWKEAKVVPIYKSGSRDDCNNYRPVSVLPILSKILERHVYNYLYQYLQQHDILTSTQFGFRKNHSCQTALLSLTEEMYEAINEGKFFGMVQLDFSKAFDLVNHELLIQKLKLHKCDDKSLQWFRSYLNDRKQRVVIQNSKSSQSLIRSGVPQGSILGPLLFLIFINDMPQFISRSKDMMYADDINLFSAHQSVQFIEEALNVDSLAAYNWGLSNDMVLNPKKCSSMLISSQQKKARSKQDTHLNIKIRNDIIPSVPSTKLLGVVIDSNITWNEQIGNIHNHIARNLFLLKQIKYYLSIADRKTFYNSFILPYFDYCCVIWGNCSKHLLFDIIKLQKKAARLILDKDITTPSKKLFSELSWMPIQERISYHYSLQVFKCLNGLAPEQLQNLFTPTNAIHCHNTRSATTNNLHIGPKHTRSFTHLGAKSWNNLPFSVRNSKTIAAFKTSYAANLNSF